MDTQLRSLNPYYNGRYSWSIGKPVEFKGGKMAS